MSTVAYIISGFLYAKLKEKILEEVVYETNMAEAAGTELHPKDIADSKNHEVAELPSQPNAHQVNSGGSYCEHHPKELIKMYCYDDNVTICLICFAESHQSHKCADVEKAAGEFVELLKEDRKTVTSRLTECEEVEQKLQIYEKEFTEQISDTEATIRETGTKLKKLIDDHAELLIQNLRSVTEKNVKVFENTKQDIARFKVVIESYSKNAEELLSPTSSTDICKTANQMHVRACELGKLPANSSGDSFRCDTVTFHPSSLENLLEQRNSINAVGELTVAESPDRIIKFEIKTSGNQLPPWQTAFHKNFSTVKVSGIPRDVTKDMISLYFENKKLSGGGKHEVLEHNEEEGKVVIKFNNHEDAIEVCRRQHVLCGATLKISALEMLLDGFRSCAAEAKSRHERATELFLELLFQKKG